MTRKLRTLVGFKPGLDFRSDGGYIVAPPSNHESGKEYVWADLSVEPVPAPDWMKTKGQVKAVQPNSGTVLRGWSQCLLDESCWFHETAQDASQEAIEKGLLAENNEKCNPPLDEGEVLNIARSASRYEPEIEQQENKSSLLSTDAARSIKVENRINSQGY
jgi:putative DNA primase/helicase